MKINTEQELQELTAIVSELALLKYFPSEPAALVALVRDVAAMVHTMNDAKWLVRRVRELYNEWPGPMELRAVYCYDHSPDDGVRAVSAVYEYGFPGGGSEDWRRQITGPTPEPIPWPEEELAEAQRILDEASRKARDKWRKLRPYAPSLDEQQFERKLQETITSPTNRKEVTAAEVEAEREAGKAKR